MTQDLSKYRELRNENLWTPQIVYDVPPPNELVRDSYNYGEGTDNVNQEEANNSLLAGVADFFAKLLGGIGDILGGIVEAGVGLLGAVVDGVVALVGGIANAIGSIFGGNPSSPEYAQREIMSPIKADLESALQPFIDDVDEALDKGEQALVYADEINDAIAQELDPDFEDSAMWRMQVQHNALTQEVLEAHQIAINANSLALRSLSKFVSRHLFIPPGASVSNEHWSVSRSGSNVTFTALGGWAGSAVIQYTYRRQQTVEGNIVNFYETGLNQMPVPLPDGSKQSEGSGILNNQAIFINYTIQPGTPVSESIPPTPRSGTLSDSQWTTLGSWVAPADSSIVASAHMIWANKTHLGDYRMRFRIGTTDVTAHSFGEGAPLLGHGPRSHYASIDLQAIKSGQRLEIQAYAGHSNPLNREYTNAQMELTWIRGTDDS